MLQRCTVLQRCAELQRCSITPCCSVGLCCTVLQYGVPCHLREPKPSAAAAKPLARAAHSHEPGESLELLQEFDAGYATGHMQVQFADRLYRIRYVDDSSESESEPPVRAADPSHLREWDGDGPPAYPDYDPS